MPEERLQQQSRHRRCPEGEQHWCCETTSFFLKGGGEFGKEIVLICPILLISRLRLSIPVFTLSPHEETLRKVTLYYGVKPLGLSAPAEHFSELLEMCKDEALKTDYLKKNDYMIVTIGHPITTASGHTNLIKAIKI